MLFNLLLLAVAIVVLALGAYSIKSLLKGGQSHLARVLVAVTGVYAGLAILAFLSSLVKG